jgi:hypothetical protein
MHPRFEGCDHLVVELGGAGGSQHRTSESPPPNEEKGALMATLTDTPTEYDTLTERVDRLIQPGEHPLVWGNPLLSSTPRSVAIHELALRIEALETGLHEITAEVQRLIDD